MRSIAVQHGRRTLAGIALHAERAQQPQRRLGALEIAAEPEQIVGGTARHHAGDAPDPHGVARRQQRDGRNRLVRHHPDVGRPRAVAHRYRARIGLVGDPAEAAGHDGPAVARRGREHPQHERARRDAAIVPHRRGRQPHQFLADKVDAAILDRSLEPFALAGRQFAARIGPLPGNRERLCRKRPRWRIRRAAQHFLARGLLATPPGRDMRHLQIFAEEALRSGWAGNQQRPRLHHAGARHIGDHDAVLAARRRSGRARRAARRRRAPADRANWIDPAQQHVEPLRPATVRISMRSPLTADRRPRPAGKPR